MTIERRLAWNKFLTEQRVRIRTLSHNPWLFLAGHRPGAPGSGRTWARYGALAAALLMGTGGCGAPVPWEWPIPEGYPLPVVPEDNPMSAARVELGRHLFYDRRLSGNGEQACASCHRPERAFSEPRPRAVGSTGAVHPRNSPALVNIAYNATLMWAHPGLFRIERQLLIPMFGEAPVELGITGREQEVLGRFRADPRYRRLFADAFPGAARLEFTHIVDALACFVRSLVSFDSPFDRYAYAGEDDALSTAAIRGLGFFFSERFECHHCHGGFNFTQSTSHESTATPEDPFHNTGLYNVGGENAYPAGDQGLYDLTGKPEDRGRFRAPTLRNVALTAPYMHDGSIPDLGGVLDFYAAGGRNIEAGEHAGDGRNNLYKSQFVKGFDMTAQERAEMLAFLHALTDPAFLERPGHRNPFPQEPVRQ